MRFRLVYMGPDDEPEGSSFVPQSSAQRTADSSPSLQYAQQGTEMVRRERLRNGGWKCIPIANFGARIVRDIRLDDGAREQRAFGLQATVGPRQIAFAVPAAEFSRMSWVGPQLGPQAIVYPGQQQHARAAIQSLSGPIATQRIFTHLGWRKLDGHWVYLQAEGALGGPSTLDGCQVQLSTALHGYRLPPPPQGGARVQAIQASLQLLELAVDRISLPLLAAVYRAALGAVNFSMFVSGPSGVFKSSIAAVCQQHFGASLDAQHLPGHFASTANALEWLAFAAKDALLVVDDFAPTGGTGDGELYGVAERLFRGIGNHQGRQRLAGDGRLEAARTPRALVLATGEQVPTGQSLRARLLIVEVGPGEVQRTVLCACQRAGQEGLLAGAMAAFVSWLAGQYEEVQDNHQRRVWELRGQWEAGHARTPAALAELQGGWEIFLRFAAEAGAIRGTQQEELRQRSARALAQLIPGQSGHTENGDPAARFLGLLQAALAGGRAHVADRRGGRPMDAAGWGWQTKGRAWAARGSCIGWTVGNDLFLDPSASYEMAQAQAGAAGLAVGPQALRHRLRQRGLLASVDAGRHMLQVRRTLAGQPRLVLHVRVGDFLGSSGTKR